MHYNYDLSLILLNCGEPALPLCLESAGDLVAHTIDFVAPQSKALNLMIQNAQTEYFIELNADIILHRNWLTRVEEKIADWQDDKCYSVIFSLWDVLTQERILALKVFKTAIMKENLFVDCPTPDVEHYQRMEKQGFYTNVKPSQTEPPIGYHVVKGKAFCYSKYKDVYKTYRTHGFEWDQGVFKGGQTLLEKSKEHFNFFSSRYDATGDPDYLACIAGMYEGLTTELDGKSKSWENRDVDITNACEQYRQWFKSRKSRIF